MLIYLLIFLISAYFYWHFVHKRRGLPPGPTPLPIFGNLLEVLKEPPGDTVYARWRKNYGDVYTYWLGAIPVVAVTEYKTIMETFQKDGDTFAGRWTFPDFDTMVRAGHHGVMFVEDDLWREHRRFVLQVLRDFGLGKNLMQDRILDEIHTIFESIERNTKNEHPICDHIDLAVGSIINCLLFGYRFQGEKRKEFFDLKERVQSHFQANGHPFLFISMSNPYFFAKLPFFSKVLKISEESGRFLVNFFRDQIEEHKKSLTKRRSQKIMYMR